MEHKHTINSKSFKLSLKNIFLHKRRSLLTGSVMVFSVIAIIVAASMGEAFYRQLTNVGIQTATGHLQVIRKNSDFDLLNPTSGDTPKIENIKKIESIIVNAPHYKTHGIEILYPMLLYDKNDSYHPGTIVGVQPKKLLGTIGGLKMMNGDLNIVNNIENGILISEKMFEYFKIPLDNEMFIVTSGELGLMNGVATVYKGTVDYMPLLAGQIAYVNISKVRELLGWDITAGTNLKVMLTNKLHAEETAAWLTRQFKKEGFPLVVLNWKQLGGFYYHIALIGRFLVTILLFILAVITCISVLNTMLMSVKERMREIGTIMALGMRRSEIMVLFLMESFLLSVISAFIGVVVGVSLTLIFEKYGLVHGLNLVLEGMLLPKPELAPVLLSFFWVVLCGTFGGLFPAWKASRLDPIVVLRNV